MTYMAGIYVKWKILWSPQTYFSVVYKGSGFPTGHFCGGGGGEPPPQTLFTPPKKRARIGMNRALGHLCAHAKLGQENLLRMVRWLRWHCPPDTVFEIRALAVWGRARYLSVTEAPHNTDVDGEETFLFLSNRRVREPNPELLRERQRC